MSFYTGLLLDVIQIERQRATLWGCYFWPNDNSKSYFSGPEVLFKTCVAMKFFDDDDDDDDDDYVSSGV